MTTQTDAVGRAMEMMTTPQNELPPLALEFARSLCRQVGMCGEVFVTAFAAYAQEVEGLPCEDDLYRTIPEHKEWFKQRSQS